MVMETRILKRMPELLLALTVFASALHQL